MLMGEAKIDQEMLWTTKETGGHDGIAVLGRCWISPAQYTKQIKPKKRKRERERSNYFPCTQNQRILCNSFNCKTNQHPKKNPKKVSDTSEASGFSTKDL
jgi:hypothetical protein